MLNILEAVKQYGSYTFACGAVGISQQYLSKLRKRWPDFDEACYVAHAQGNGKYVSIIHDAALGTGRFQGQKPDLNAAMWILKTQAAAEYAPNKELFTSGSGGFTIISNVPMPTPLAELPEATED